MYREATAEYWLKNEGLIGITPMYREATPNLLEGVNFKKGITPMYREATLEKRLYRAFLFLEF